MKVIINGKETGIKIPDNIGLKENEKIEKIDGKWCLVKYSITEEEIQEIQKLINLLFNRHISQYGKRKIVDYINKITDLYNKEKEKNKRAIEYMDRYEVNSTGKPFSYTEIGKELCRILQEK